MTIQPITVAGCRIPITLDINNNLQEIKKAIDWASENSVDILSTPECAVSGYLWNPDTWHDSRVQEINDAITEIKSYSKDKSVDIILGTSLFDNEKRWINCQKYILGGQDLFDYSKNQLTEVDSNFYQRRGYLPPLLNYKGHMISGLICNDYWASVFSNPEHGELLRYLRDNKVKIVFVSAFQFKDPGPGLLYYKWGEANLLMNSFMGNFYTVCSDTNTRTDGDAYSGDPCAPVGIIDYDGKWLEKGSDIEPCFFKQIVY